MALSGSEPGRELGVAPPPEKTTGSTGRTHGDRPVMTPPTRPVNTSVTPQPPADGSLGTVAVLRRHPVKSMLGEDLTASAPT